MNIENYNIQQELQEKFITKLVLNYISDVFVEYARLIKDNALEHQNKGHFYIAELNELVEMAKQAVENIRNKYEK